MAKKKGLTEKQQKRTRLIVHNTFAIIFLGCVFLFRYIDNGSLIQLLLVVAGYTYGPLLALFCFGIFLKRQIRNELVPLACVAGPVLCFILKQFDKDWLDGYVIGTELLVINGLLTFLLLLLCSKKGHRTEAA